MFDRRKSQSALVNKTPVVSAGIGLTPLPEGLIVHVLAKTNDAGVADFIARYTANTGYMFRPAGLGQWFIVGDAPLSPSMLDSLIEKLLPRLYGVDQSHGRVRILVEGPMVEKMLAKGTAVDLALSSFPVNHATTTLIGRVSAHLTRLSDTSFEIMPARSFAESLWDDLLQMSVEYA